MVDHNDHRANSSLVGRQPCNKADRTWHNRAVLKGLNLSKASSSNSQLSVSKSLMNFVV